MSLLRFFGKPIVFTLTFNALLFAAVMAGLHPVRSTESDSSPLLVRAQKVYQRENAKPDRDLAYLSSLSIAIRFQDAPRIQELLSKRDL